MRADVRRLHSPCSPTATAPTLPADARRKNKVLRMSYRAPDSDEPSKWPVPTEPVSQKGKPSSDVTKGFEKIYERSYY